MGKHYFTNEELDHVVLHNFTYTYKNKLLQFTSSSGVFSKKHMDFGTHVLLQSLPNLSNKCDILDVGCGVGTIGLSLAKVYEDLHVDMIDVNEQAILLAHENKSKNGIENADIFVSDIYQNITKQYDCIITNPPIRAGKKVVQEIVKNAKLHLKENGELYLVIAKKQGAPSMIEFIKEVYGKCQILAKEGGYFILQTVK